MDTDPDATTQCPTRARSILVARDYLEIAKRSRTFEVRPPVGVVA